MTDSRAIINNFKVVTRLATEPRKAEFVEYDFRRSEPLR